jgi:hypothetical protein
VLTQHFRHWTRIGARSLSAIERNGIRNAAIFPFADLPMLIARKVSRVRRRHGNLTDSRPGTPVHEATTAVRYLWRDRVLRIDSKEDIIGTGAFSVEKNSGI